MKILIVEDENVTASYLRRGLMEEGYTVEVAHSSGHADEAIHLQQFDLVLLDVMLPGKNGFELCADWRAQGLRAPILILSGRQSVADRITGLDAGADDYLVKPFAFDELLARIRALLRRPAHSEMESSIVLGPLVVDPVRREARLDGRPMDLTVRELNLLEVLARRSRRVVSRTVLWESVWESHAEPNSNVVDVYVGYLRKKLGKHAAMLRTVRGSGYTLEAETSGPGPI
jgi:DNA-binding response OmpR family regulator